MMSTSLSMHLQKKNKKRKKKTKKHVMSCVIGIFLEETTVFYSFYLATGVSFNLVNKSHEKPQSSHVFVYSDFFLRSSVALCPHSVGSCLRSKSLNTNSRPRVVHIKLMGVNSASVVGDCFHAHLVFVVFTVMKEHFTSAAHLYRYPMMV